MCYGVLDYQRAIRLRSPHPLSTLATGIQNLLAATAGVGYAAFERG